MQFNKVNNKEQLVFLVSGIRVVVQAQSDSTIVLACTGADPGFFDRGVPGFSRKCEVD